MITEDNNSLEEKDLPENPENIHQADMDTEVAEKIPEEKVLSEIDPEKASDKISAKLHVSEEDNEKHKLQRQEIIDRLKNLYTNSEPGTNLFKEIRDIKEAWRNAGMVNKGDFKLLNSNYFHHLNAFYQMLDFNKEYLQQEYAHNLEKRENIIARAKELLEEKVVQKALNELQYLHKLWKEEAEPVAEEYREKTWDLFKEISGKIHDRKAELSAGMEQVQQENLVKKNNIIAELKALASPEKTPNHSYWQQSIKKVEQLRTDFLQTGSVPKKLSNENWTEFKKVLKDFNNAKNEFYKNLKGSQSDNLAKKLELIKTAQDNAESEDWETAVPLFKKIQEEWKTIGHVPRSHADKIWAEFREASNRFFDRFREKNGTETDNWKENLKKKQQLLQDLKNIGEDESSAKKIDEIKAAWNATGKVPKDKISINSEFNKTLREKLKLNKISEFDLKDENLSESQSNDKARKIKNQISDLENEIVTLENNLGFFKNPTRENPLLQDTFRKIDDKKAQAENLRKTLHSLVSGE